MAFRSKKQDKSKYLNTYYFISEGRRLGYGHSRQKTNCSDVNTYLHSSFHCWSKGKSGSSWCGAGNEEKSVVYTGQTDWEFGWCGVKCYSALQCRCKSGFAFFQDVKCRVMRCTVTRWKCSVSSVWCRRSGDVGGLSSSHIPMIARQGLDRYMNYIPIKMSFCLLFSPDLKILLITLFSSTCRISQVFWS